VSEDAAAPELGGKTFAGIWSNLSKPEHQLEPGVVRPRPVQPGLELVLHWLDRAVVLGEALSEERVHRSDLQGPKRVA
jgi:hypothetical protein